MNGAALKRALAATAFACTLMTGLDPAGSATELPPMRWKAGFWRITGQTDYFRTTTNYDSSRGSFVRLPGDSSFQGFESRLRGRYNLTPSLSLYGGMGAAYVRSVGPAAEKSNSAPTEVFAGGDYVVWKKWARVIAELEVSYPLDPIDPDTTEALTSEGVMFARAHLFAFRPMRWATLHAHMGINRRDEGLSTLLLWGVGAEKPFKKRFLAGAGLEGSESIIKDELSPRERNDVTDRVNAGSHYFYAHNPATIEGRLWFGFQPAAAWQFRLGYGQTFNGANAAAASQAFLAVSYNFDPRPGRENFGSYHRDREQIRKKSRRALKKFRTETEAQDPDLFDAEDTFEPDLETDPAPPDELLED